jgi:hypothetical protein
MSTFSIAFTNKEPQNNEQVAHGYLKIGTFEECFEASLTYWKRSDYENHWSEGLKRLLLGNDKSALVTSMNDPQNANFIFWWVMYVLGGRVYIQNHVLFLERLDMAFDEKNIYKHIPIRETHTEEGVPLSEWVVDLDDIASFLKDNKLI